jgi:hypothetical protein
VGLYAEEKLNENGHLSELALSTIMENFPRMGLYTKTGKEENIVKGFVRNARDVKPYISEMFISVPQWWQMLNDIGDDNGWSIPLRVRFLARTGGLDNNNKKYDSNRTLVTSFMRDVKSWLSNYERSTPSEDNAYWFKIWVDVSVKVITEFHTVQHTDDIMKGGRDLCSEEKYIFKSKVDPLNEDFFRVVLLYQDIIRWLKERSSDLVNSPLYVYQLLKEWLEKQGEKGVGKVMANHIGKALAKLNTNPESVFPTNHGLSANQLKEVKTRGQGRATSNTYRLILENLKRRALQKDLNFELYSMQQIADLYSSETGGKIGKAGNESTNSDSDKKGGGRNKDRKANNTVVSTDLSTLTSLNTTANGVERPSPCTECRMFHDNSGSGGCPFWDSENKMFHVKAFLKHRSARQICADGSSKVNPFWLNKLQNFGFPGMKIFKASDQKKIIDDLNTAAKNWPIASVEERKRYADRNRKYINMALTEDGDTSENASLHAKLDALSNHINVGAAAADPSKSSGKVSRKKSKKKKKKDDSSDDADTETDSDSDGSASN